MKQTYKQLSLQIEANLKCIKSYGTYRIIKGNAKCHTAYSSAFIKSSDAWKDCYEKLQQSNLNPVGKHLKLKEMPQLRFGNPNVTVGKKYLILDTEGSNFWLNDDDGNRVSFGSSRF